MSEFHVPSYPRPLTVGAQGTKGLTMAERVG